MIKCLILYFHSTFSLILFVFNKINLIILYFEIILKIIFAIHKWYHELLHTLHAISQPKPTMGNLHETIYHIYGNRDRHPS